MRSVPTLNPVARLNNVVARAKKGLSSGLAFALVIAGISLTATAAHAAFVPTASMPTAPGVRWGELPNGAFGNVTSKPTGRYYKIYSTGYNTAVTGPNGNACACYGGEIPQNLKTITVDESNEKIWVMGPTVSDLTSLNGAAQYLTGTATRYSTQGVTGFTQLTVNPATHFVYVLHPSDDSVYEFDSATQTWTQISLSVNNAAAKDLEVDTTNSKLLVTLSATAQVEVIDLATLVSDGLVSVGSAPWGISIDNTNKLAYIANSAGNSISVLSLSSPSLPTVTSTLPFTTMQPKYLDIDPVNRFLYVGSTSSGVAVVDILGNNAVNEVSGYGTSIISVAADPISRLAYYTTDSLHQPNYYYANTIGYIPEITSATPPPNGVIGTAYAGHQMTAIGSATITYALQTANTLPPGLTISSGGAISGTPTAPGVYTFTVVADNGFGTDSETYTITIPVPPPTLTSMTFTDGYAGEPYKYSHPWYGAQDYVLTSTWLGSAYAANGISSFQVSSGSLPPGLSLNANTGTISGTVGSSISSATTYNFTVLGTNSTSTTTQSYSITIQPAQPVIDTNNTVWSQTPTEGYNQYAWIWPALVSGSPSADWTVSAGALPAGLSFDPTGPRVTGTITAAAGSAYNFTLRATNAGSGLYDEISFSGTIAGAPPAFGSTQLTGFEGVPFYFDPNANFGFYTAGVGGTPMTWAISPNTIDQFSSIPGTIALNTTSGVISGTPTTGAATGSGFYGQTGIYNFELDVTNAYGSSFTTPIIAILPTPTGVENLTMTESVASVGNLNVDPNGPTPNPYGTYWNTVHGAAMPTWFTFDDNFNGSGTGSYSITAPIGSAGTYQFAVSYLDANWNPIYQIVNLTVNPAPPVLNATESISTTSGAAITHTITNTGGAATFAVSSGSLPSGVSLNASTGAITGSAASGTYTFDVTATNVSGTSTTTVTLVAASTPVVASPISVTWRVGTASTYTITPTGGATPMTFTVNAGSTRPSWVSLNANTGVLSGTPTSASTNSFDVDVTNASGTTTVTVNLSALIAPSVPATTTITTPSVGVPYTYTLPTPTGTGPFTFAIGTGSLPAGLSLNTSTGAITGTPTTPGPATFTISVTNGLGVGAAVSTSVSTTVTTLAPQYTTPYGQYLADSTLTTITPSHTGGSPATSWAVANGSTIPSWLTLDPNTGVLSGTSPSTAVVEAFSIVGTNATGSATIALTLNVQLAAGLGAISLPTPVIGVPFTYTIPTTGTGAFTFNLTGSLPAGLSLNTSTGVISGTPTGTGSTGNFTVTVNNGLSTQNSTGGATSSSLTLTSSVAAPTATATATLNSANRAAVNYTFPQTGGTPATSWSSQNLPSGLTFANGVLSGTPAASGTYTITLTGTNSAGSASTTVTLNVTAPPVVSNPTVATTFTAGLPNTYTIVTSGSPSASSFTTTSTLPNWLTLNASTGVLTGTPPAGTASPYSFPVTVSNGVGTPTTVTVNIPIQTVAPTLPATTTVPLIGPGVVSTHTITQSGGTPGTFSLASSPAAPNWVSINPTTGVLTFTNPPVGAIGTHTFNVVSTNSAGSASTAVTVTVADVPVLPATLHYAIPTNTVWSHDIATDVTSGATPWTFAVASSSTLPGWLTLTGSTLSGSTGTPATDTFTIEVSNANGTSITVVTIDSLHVPALGTYSLPAATGVAFSQTITPTSGTGPFTFAISAGSLPAGLTLNSSTGVISGTPTTAGLSNFTITATNGLGAGSAASSNSSIQVLTLAPVTAATETLSGNTVTAFTHTFTASAGSPVASWAVSNGSLPAGITINVNTGVISGTPTAAGTYTFDIDATNAGGTSTTSVTFTVTSPPIVVSSATAPTAPTGSAYTYTIPVTGGGSPYTYTLSNGSLPSWATLNANGTITGTPTSAGGPTTFRINVTNSVGTTPITITLSSAVPTSVAATTTISATVNQLSTTTITPGGTGPFTFAVTNGSLPAWATLNTSTGVINGTPTSAGTGSFTVSVSGASGTASTTVNYTAAVTAPVYAATTTVYATETVAMNHAFTQSSGSNATTFTMGSGLPSSLTFSTNTGALSGTPALGEAGTYTATFTGSNSSGGNSTTVNLVVLTMPTIALTTSLPASTSGTAYSQTISGQGSGTFTFSVSSGSLPAGLRLNTTTGAIYGTPRSTAVGSHSFTITMTNQAGTAVSTVVTMTVKSGASIAATLTAKKAKKGSSYSYTIKPTGTGPFTYRVSSGSLPAGLKLNASTGKITGTPTKPGTFTFGITITAPGGTTLTTRVVLQVSAVSSATAGSGASASASPTPSASASATPSVTATPTPSASASASESASSEEPSTSNAGFGLNTMWVVGGLLALAALLGFWWLLVAKRRKDEEEDQK